MTPAARLDAAIGEQDAAGARVETRAHIRCRRLLTAAQSHGDEGRAWLTWFDEAYAPARCDLKRSLFYDNELGAIVGALGRFEAALASEPQLNLTAAPWLQIATWEELRRGLRLDDESIIQTAKDDISRLQTVERARACARLAAQTPEGRAHRDAHLSYLAAKREANHAFKRLRRTDAYAALVSAASETGVDETTSELLFEVYENEA